MNGADMEAIKRQLLLNISELLEQHGLISSEERMAGKVYGSKAAFGTGAARRHL